MIHNGRKIHNPKVIEGVWRYTTGDILHEKVLKDQAHYRELRLNSKEYKEEQAVRKITQLYSSTKMEEIKKIKILVKEKCKGFTDLVIKEFNIAKNAIKANNYEQLNITFEEIESFIHESMPLLKKLKYLSDHEEIAPSNPNYLTTYEAMFVSLIDLDVRFALFAPKRSLNKVGMDFKLDAMSEKHKRNMLELRTRLEENESLDYVSCYQGDFDSNEKIQKVIDEINEEEFKSKFEIIKSAELASLKTYNFIIGYFKSNELNVDKLKFADIKKLLVLTDMAFNVIKKASRAPELNEIASWDEFDPYTELFNNLMEVNMKFAFFAPSKSLNRLNIDFNKLSDKEKDLMQQILVKNDLWADEEFYERYKDVFSNIESTEKTV